MSERPISNRSETHEQEATPPTEGAIETALTGFASDGGAWMHGREVFERLHGEGRSIRESLDVALQAAAAASKGGIESTPTEAKLRFWDNMDNDRTEGEDPTPAIERALTGYAKDGGSWLQARNDFYEAIGNGSTIDQALAHALLLANDGSETHPEVAKDRFYGGVDPDYADREHFMGKKSGIRISAEGGSAKIEIGFGRTAEERRQRRLGRLAAEHRKQA